MSFVSSIGVQPTSGQYSTAHRQQVRDVGGRFAGGWGVAWQGLEKIDSNLYAFKDRCMDNLHEGAQALCDEMVAYMKANAPWTDQTTDARTGLQGAVVWEDPEHFTIFLGHGADIYYGIWLEVRFGGRYAIVVPTVQAFAPGFAAKIIGGRG